MGESAGLVVLLEAERDAVVLEVEDLDDLGQDIVIGPVGVF
jgi:hypothetical protein